MNAEKTRQFLKALKVQVPSSQTRTGWLVSSCPMAPWKHEGGVDRNPSFACRLEPGHARANCFSCGFHGSLSDIVHEMRYRNKQEPKVNVNWLEALHILEETEFEIGLDLDSPDLEEVLFGNRDDEIHPFPEWWLGTFHSWREFAWSRDYLLEERGVPAALADKFDIRADAKEKRVCFPVRDFDKTLVGFHGRGVSKYADPRYRMYLQAKRNNPIIWLGEHYVDLTRPLVVVEGPFDLLSVYRVYRNVVTPLFANPSVAKLMRMADCLEWITLFDRGKGGDAGREKISRVIGEDHHVQHIQPPDGSKDPGVMTVEQLIEVLGGHVPLDPVIY